MARLHRSSRSPGIKKHQIGTGSTADAIRYEIRSGDVVRGKARYKVKGHIKKGKDMINALRNVLREEPLSDADRRKAEMILRDLEMALEGN